MRKAGAGAIRRVSPPPWREIDRWSGATDRFYRAYARWGGHEGRPKYTVILRNLVASNSLPYEQFNPLFFSRHNFDKTRAMSILPVFAISTRFA